LGDAAVCHMMLVLSDSDVLVVAAGRGDLYVHVRVKYDDPMI